jgi:hypothetical protein
MALSPALLKRDDVTIRSRKSDADATQLFIAPETTLHCGDLAVTLAPAAGGRITRAGIDQHEHRLAGAARRRRRAKRLRIDGLAQGRLLSAAAVFEPHPAGGLQFRRPHGAAAAAPGRTPRPARRRAAAPGG